MVAKKTQTTPDSIEVLRPNPGPQEDALACPATICIYGGAAGCGKTMMLLMDGGLRGKDDPHFKSVYLRRTTKNVRNQGGLWDAAKRLYAKFGGRPREGERHDITFPSGSNVLFTHCQHEKNAEDHKGGEYTHVAFDELTEFTEYQFWYIFGRLRSPQSQFEPWLRASTNPKPGWVLDLIEWWIGDDGLPIPERAGVIRWIRRDDNGKIEWFDEETKGATSFTFIPGKLEDNPALTEADPTYRDKLAMLSYVERERLLGGNWRVDNTGGLFEKHRIGRSTAVRIEQVPRGKLGRYWDLADTTPTKKNPSPDSTASAKGMLHTDQHGQEHLYLFDVTVDQIHGAAKREMMQRLAEEDGVEVAIGIEQEPGSSGKEVARDYRLVHLQGFHVITDPPVGDKVTRATRWLAMAEHGNVHVVLTPDGKLPGWFTALEASLSGFPNKPRDIVDAISGLYSMLKKTGKGPRLTIGIARRG